MACKTLTSWVLTNSLGNPVQSLLGKRSKRITDCRNTARDYDGIRCILMLVNYYGNIYNSTRTNPNISEIPPSTSHQYSTQVDLFQRPNTQKLKGVLPTNREPASITPLMLPLVIPAHVTFIFHPAVQHTTRSAFP